MKWPTISRGANRPRRPDGTGAPYVRHMRRSGRACALEQRAGTAAAGHARHRAGGAGTHGPDAQPHCAHPQRADQRLAGLRVPGCRRHRQGGTGGIPGPGVAGGPWGPGGRGGGVGGEGKGGGGVMEGGLPVNVLTGFLGSEKTSLLNRLLRDPAFSHCAVLINEFGTIGIDHHLVEAVDGDLVLLSSGCVCCTIRGDLRAAIRGLYERRERGAVAPFTRLLIETTGLADPTPVLATVMHDPVLRAHLRAGNVITTVDAVHAHGQLERHPQSRKQVAVADRLVVTKAELASPGALAALLQELAQLNPAALVCLAGPKALDAQALLGQDMFQKQGKSEELGRWLDAARQRRYAPVQHGGAHGGIESFVLEPGNDVDWLAFSLWLSLLLHRHGEQVLRVKGLIHVAGASTPVAIHGVQQLMHPPLHLTRWPQGWHRSCLVFLVQGLAPEQVQASWRNCQRHLAA